MNNLRRGCLGILAVLITVTLSACSEGQGKSHKQREQAGRSEPRVSGGESGGKPVEAPNAKPRIVPENKVVEDEVKVYYYAAARGDYDYTYEHLTDLDQMAFTHSEWVQANTNLQSEQGTYEITAVRKVSDGEYDVDLLVSGTPRTTRFVYATEAGVYKHELTSEEIEMFTDALSSASASASASVSASTK